KKMGNGKIAKGKIEIRDNRNGMDLERIKKGWLTISRSIKRKMKENDELTPKFNRLPLGDKGLGRLSAQRLGNFFSVVTKQEGTKEELSVDIDWSLFQGDVTLSQVDIHVETNSVSDKNTKKSYTKITILDLKNLDDWRSNKYIDEFEKNLSKIVSPFDISKKFIIKAKVGQRDLEFPEIENQMLKSAPANYELILHKESLEIKGAYRIEFFGLNIKDRLQEFVELYKDKLQINSIEYLTEGNFVFKFTKNIMLCDIGNLNLEYHPGIFTGKLFDFSLDAKLFKKLSNIGIYQNYENLSEFRKYIKENAGVKIYRDNFRVFPYGEKGHTMGFDWLGFSESFTSGKYTDLKSGNVVGYIKLTGLENKKLKELTSREGLIDDYYSRAFFNICRFAVKEINENRNLLNTMYASYMKEKNASKEAQSDQLPSHQEAKQDIIEAAENSSNVANEVSEYKEQVLNITQDIEKTRNRLMLSKNITKEQRDDIADLINEIKNKATKIEDLFNSVINSFQKIEKIKGSAVSLVEQIELSMSQVQEVMELAGLGITAESLTHELYTLINNSKSDIQNSRKYFNKYYEVDDQMEFYFQSITVRLDSLRKQITHLSPGFKSVRTKKQTIGLKQLVEEHFTFYKDRANRSEINLINVNPDGDFSIYANKGSMIQVLDNLFSNSEYWLNHAYDNKLIEEKNFFIEVSPNGFIYVWDSGIGISRNIEERIFEPFITSRLEGRGLGLYIITRLLLNNGCTIRLMEVKNNKGNKYKMEIDLTNVLVEG
ncbi:ATP-binding protein, partial [Aneurinibacillus migulanus]